jgi:biofilm PGA synthesis N-glycosyltransferase PgaC
LHQQTVRPEQIIVVDDCSTDGTAAVAENCGFNGVTVVRPLANTGSKAGAQNFALPAVTTEFTMALDADTTLAPDAIERLLEAFREHTVVAACGFVIPRFVRTLWERGRYIEYLLAFTWYKQIQNYYKKPLISSGCFSIYRTAVLKRFRGWSTRTMAEDMDLTWTFYRARHEVRFVPQAVCYPIEPHNREFMYRQLRRWSHGFVQNVRLHWRGLLDVPYLRSIVAVALFDAAVASFCYLFLIPVLAIVLRQPLILLAYVIDVPVVMIPALLTAFGRREILKTLASLPAFFVLRTVNGGFILAALWKELVLRQPLLVYEKGH